MSTFFDQNSYGVTRKLRNTWDMPGCLSMILCDPILWSHTSTPRSKLRFDSFKEIVFFRDIWSTFLELDLYLELDYI